MKKIIALLLSAAVFYPVISLAQANLVTAQDYLTSHAQDPWSTMALSVLGASSIPSDYLKTVNGTSAIEYEAPILAIIALNKNPGTFGATDYITKLNSYHNDGQIGDPSTVNDDIFGLLALISAGESISDPVASDAKNFILANQQPNGGWGFAIAGGTDSNMTAAAIVALIAGGVSVTNPIIQNGFDYLHTTQNDDGGFTYDPQSQWGTASDSSSTAWVIWALNAANINPSDWLKPGGTPIDYLESNQTPSGYFQYQSGFGEDSFSAVTTAYAVIALTGQTLPVRVSFPSNTNGGSNTGSVKSPDPEQAPVPPQLPAVELPGEVLGITSSLDMDGTLALDISDGRTVYLIGNGGIKRGFVSESVFKGLGYSFDQVVKMDVSTYIMGDPITSADSAHPDGTLVISGSTIWWINRGQRYGVTSTEVFNSHGWKMTSVLSANSADLLLPEGPIL